MYNSSNNQPSSQQNSSVFTLSDQNKDAVHSIWSRRRVRSECFLLDSYPGQTIISGQSYLPTEIMSCQSDLPSEIMSGQSDPPSGHLSKDGDEHGILIPDVSIRSQDSGVLVKEADSPESSETLSVGPLSDSFNTSDTFPLVSNRATKRRPPNQTVQPYATAPPNSCPVILRNRQTRDAAANYNNIFQAIPSDRKRYMPTTTNRVKSVSERFYDESSDQPADQRQTDIDIHDEDEPHKNNIKQSKRLPNWAWYLLSKSLGIKSRPDEKPVCATILYILTLLFGITFFMTYTWRKVYDIVSVRTKSTVLTGSVEIVICLCWVSLTVYANKCAARLFASKNFVRSVRLHSKTIFKVSAVGLIAILAVAFMCLNSYHAYSTFDDNHCLTVNLTKVICKIVYPVRVSFNIFGILWNLLVAFVLLSVCRTHTVGVRRFIKELEMDGKRYEKFWRDKLVMENSSRHRVDIDCLNLHTELGSEWLIWDDRLTTTDVVEDPDVMATDSRRRTNSRLSTQTGNLSIQSVESRRSEENGARTKYISPNTQPPVDSPGAQDGRVEEEEDYSQLDTPPIMTNEDILLCYWKIACRMRVTSLCLQRWLSSWIIFVVLWCSNYVIYWTSHSATIIGIAEFLIPLFMIPLLASAYAEVNAEGQRMIRSICPVEERMSLLFYLGQQPLQMTVFNFPVTYQVIVGVIAAFAVAFASRIILDEVLTK